MKDTHIDFSVRASPSEMSDNLAEKLTSSLSQFERQTKRKVPLCISINRLLTGEWVFGYEKQNYPRLKFLVQTPNIFTLQREMKTNPHKLEPEIV